MADSASQSCLHTCIACGYDLSAINTRQCPECGYTASDEDVTVEPRRRMFLELTRLVAWAPAAGVIVVGIATGAVHFAVLLAIHGLALMGGWVTARRAPALHRRVFRRAWAVSSAYWLLLVLLFQMVTPWIESWMEYSSFSFYSPYGRYRSSWVEPPILMGTELTILTLSVFIWYFAWKRTARIAGVPEDMRTRRAFRRGVFIAMIPLIPPAAIILLGAIIGAAMWMLDRFLPGWELGR